eukprot:746011-Hanusia_phi.AAC.2
MVRIQAGGYSHQLQASPEARSSLRGTSLAKKCCFPRYSPSQSPLSFPSHLPMMLIAAHGLVGDAERSSWLQPGMIPPLHSPAPPAAAAPAAAAAAAAAGAGAAAPPPSPPASPPIPFHAV